MKALMRGFLAGFGFALGASVAGTLIGYAIGRIGEAQVKRLLSPEQTSSPSPSSSPASSEPSDDWTRPEKDTPENAAWREGYEEGLAMGSGVDTRDHNRHYGAEEYKILFPACEHRPQVKAYPQPCPECAKHKPHYGAPRVELTPEVLQPYLRALSEIREDNPEATAFDALVAAFRAAGIEVISAQRKSNYDATGWKTDHKFVPPPSGHLGTGCFFKDENGTICGFPGVAHHSDDYVADIEGRVHLLVPEKFQMACGRKIGQHWGSALNREFVNCPFCLAVDNGELTADSPEGRNAQREHCREVHASHLHQPDSWWCCAGDVCRHTDMENVPVTDWSICGDRGFSGSTSCVLTAGHEGKHFYDLPGGSDA